MTEREDAEGHEHTFRAMYNFGEGRCFELCECGEEREGWDF